MNIFTNEAKNNQYSPDSIAKLKQNIFNITNNVILFG